MNSIWKSVSVLMLLAALVIVSGAALGERASFGSVSADTTATYLDMGDMVISDWNGFYAFLEKFPSLEKVDMFATQVKKPKIEEMAARFPDIEFGWTMRIVEHTIRTDQTAFSTLHGDPSDPMHGEDDFSILKYCKNLMALDVGHNYIYDLSFLYDLPKLRVLIVACNCITDITPVGSLKDLEYLELFWNRIEDISPLTNLTHLIDLNLVNNYIKDLSPLYEMKTLKRLWTHHYNMHGMLDPATPMRQLREALPDVHIDNDSTSTAGGWRVNPHYDVIYRMFRTTVYEPFEDSYPLEADANPDTADTVLTVSAVEESSASDDTESTTEAGGLRVIIIR